MPGVSAMPQLFVPLLADGRALGVVEVDGRQETAENPAGYYTPSDTANLQMLQSQLAFSMERRRKEIDRAEFVAIASPEMAKIFRDALETGSSNTVGRVLQKIVRPAARLCGARYCSIFLWNETCRAYVLAATKGLPQRNIGCASYNPGEGLTGWVAAHGRPLRLDNRSPKYLKMIDPPPVWKEKHKEGRCRKKLTRRPFMAEPIFSGGRSIGVIRVSDRVKGPSDAATCGERVLRFGGNHQHILRLIASNISNVLAQFEHQKHRIELLGRLEESRNILTSALAKLDHGLRALVDSDLKDAVEKAATAVGADIVTLFPVNPEVNQFEGMPIAGGSPKEPHLIDIPTPDMGDPAFWILHRESHYWCSLPPKFRHRRKSADPNAPTHPRFASRENIRSVAALRLEVGDQVLGVMFLSFRQQQVFDIETRQIIESFASHVALCLEVARLSQDIRESAAREKAHYLARELHDGVLSVLSDKVIRGIGGATDLLRSHDFEGAVKRLKDVEGAASYCHEECANIVKFLESPAIGQLGLRGALKKLEDLRATPAIRVHVSESEPPIPVSIKQALHRVCQEAVRNVIKHARAQNVDILLAVDVVNRVARLQISDDGTGFTTGTGSRQGHYGLINMQERIEAIGGSIQITSGPEGTKIIAEVPLQGGANAHNE